VDIRTTKQHSIEDETAVVVAAEQRDDLAGEVVEEEVPELAEAGATVGAEKGAGSGPGVER
jgi:hypothetical protein